MEEASRSFTDMGELLTRAGVFVADLMGVEAPFITSGGAAGLGPERRGLLSGQRPRQAEQATRHHGDEERHPGAEEALAYYDRILASSGARLVEVSGAPLPGV